MLFKAITEKKKDKILVLRFYSHLIESTKLYDWTPGFFHFGDGSGPSPDGCELSVLQ